MMLVLLVSLLDLQAQVKYEMHYYVAPDTTNHYLHVTLDYQQGLKVGDDTSEKMPNTRELVLNMPPRLCQAPLRLLQPTAKAIR